MTRHDPVLGPDATVVVAGASLAGLRAAESLRREGFRGELVLVGDEAHAPYDRPPLSKQVLAGTRAIDDIDLLPAADLDALAVRALYGRAAVALDTATRTVALSDGTTLAYEGLLIATGATPRRLPAIPDGLGGVHVLRTASDAAALRAELLPGRRLVVVGAGFVGCEVASTARDLGLDVTVLEAGPTPLGRGVGPEVAEAFAATMRAAGVDLRTGCTVVGTDADGRDRVRALTLDDGTVVPADVVLVAVGAAPATSWLRDSGLNVADGVRCDEHCAALGAEGVFAAGDVARVLHPLTGRAERIEHWTTAGQQGTVAARNLLRAPSDREAFADVPYFWSDQFGVKLQSVGWFATAPEHVVIDGTLDRAPFAVAAFDGDRLVGALGVNRAPIVMQLRAQIAAAAPREAVLDRFAAA